MPFDPDNTDYLVEAAQNGLNSISWYESTEIPSSVLADSFDSLTMNHLSDHSGVSREIFDEMSFEEFISGLGED